MGPKSYTPSYSPKSYSPESYTPSYSPKSYTPSYSPKSYTPYSPKSYTPSYKGKEVYVPKKFHEKEMLVPKIEKSADPIMIIPGVTKGKGIFIPHQKVAKGKAVGDLVIPDICLENVPKVKDIVVHETPKKVVPKVVPQKKGMYYNPQPQQQRGYAPPSYNKGGYQKGYQKGYAPQPTYNKGGYQNRGYAPQPTYNKGGYQKGYQNRGYAPQPTYNKGGYQKGYQNRGSVPQPSYNKGGYQKGYGNRGY